MKGWRRRSDHALNRSCHSSPCEAQQNLRACLLNHKNIRRDTGEWPTNQKQEAGMTTAICCNSGMNICVRITTRLT